MSLKKLLGLWRLKPSRYSIELTFWADIPDLNRYPLTVEVDFVKYPQGSDFYDEYRRRAVSTLCETRASCVGEF